MRLLFRPRGPGPGLWLAIGVVAILLVGPAYVPASVGAPVAPSAARSAPTTLTSPGPLGRMHLRAPVRPQTITAVYPSYGGSLSEPAPMGITDFGVTPNGTPYSYAAPAWRGTVTIGSLRTSGGGGNGYMTFQLNVVLFLQGDQRNFSYWVQNVVLVDTSNESVNLENNIWNFSSTSPPLSSGELRGNGTVNSVSGIGDWYAYGDSVVGEGNGVSLTLPATIQVEVTTGFYDGLPHVDFLYDDGFGWVSYDNVTFEHGANWKDLGYVVDGYDYAPIGPGYIFDDAEWDFSGASGGYRDELSNLSMELQYWNGHNFQEPPNAYDFGGDTGESMQNVVPSLVENVSSGSLTAREVNGSTGSLGALYGASQVATLDANISSVPNGTLDLNNQSVAYVGGAANLTLAPGNYTVTLWNGTTEIGPSENLSLSAGSLTHVRLPYVPAAFRVGFYSEGLPTGTSWSISLGEGPVASSGSWLNFTLRNGSYTAAIAGVAGFDLASYRVVVGVSGANQTIVLVWKTFLLPLGVTATGLAAGSPWSIDLSNGVSLDGDGPVTVTTALANGTYGFTIACEPWVSPDPAYGSFSIDGSPGGMFVTFSAAPSTIDGAVTPTNASLLIDGISIGALGAGGSFNFTGPPGVYNVTAAAPGYVTQYRTVTTTAGNISTLDLLLDPSTSSGGHSGGSGGTGSTGNPVRSAGGLSRGDTELLVAAAIAAAALVLLGVAWGRRASRGRP